MINLANISPLPDRYRALEFEQPRNDTVCQVYSRISEEQYRTSEMSLLQVWDRLPIEHFAFLGLMRTLVSVEKVIGAVVDTFYFLGAVFYWLYHQDSTTSFADAIESCHFTTALFFAKGLDADVNRPFDLEPIFSAISNNREGLFDYLIEQRPGLSFEEEDGVGYRALLIAVRAERISFVWKLVHCFEFPLNRDGLAETGLKALHSAGVGLHGPAVGLGPSQAVRSRALGAIIEILVNKCPEVVRALVAESPAYRQIMGGGSRLDSNGVLFMNVLGCPDVGPEVLGTLILKAVEENSEFDFSFLLTFIERTRAAGHPHAELVDRFVQALRFCKERPARAQAAAFLAAAHPRAGADSAARRSFVGDRGLEHGLFDRSLLPGIFAFSAPTIRVDGRDMSFDGLIELLENLVAVDPDVDGA